MVLQNNVGEVIVNAEDALPLIDPGNIQTTFVSGLGQVTPLGANALFSFYVLQPGEARLIEVKLIAPVEAVGPAFDLAITTLGARTMVNLAGHALGHIVGNRMRRLVQ